MSGGKKDERIEPRMEEARRWLRDHHAGITPDAGFPSRVAANLRRDPIEEMGRAALRLLPMTLALAIVLGWIALRASEGAADDGQAAGVDVVEWVYGDAETAR